MCGSARRRKGGSIVLKQAAKLRSRENLCLTCGFIAELSGVEEIIQSYSVCHSMSFRVKLTTLEWAAGFLRAWYIMKVASLINNGEKELFPIGVE